jgi:hypothetical protein
MKCPKCQAENPEDSEYCSLCFTRFQTQIRSSKVDDAARRASEENKGVKLRCPNCGEISPVKAPFCLRCGFIFDDLEAIMINEEDAEKLSREKKEQEERYLREIYGEAIPVSEETDGARLLGNLLGIMEKGSMARLHVHGRNAITHAMKIIALMGEDLRKAGKGLSLSVRLLSEGTVVHLDDLELELILKGEQES